MTHPNSSPQSCISLRGNASSKRPRVLTRHPEVSDRTRDHVKRRCILALSSLGFHKRSLRQCLHMFALRSEAGGVAMRHGTCYHRAAHGRDTAVRCTVPGCIVLRRGHEAERCYNVARGVPLRACTMGRAALSCTAVGGAALRCVASSCDTRCYGAQRSGDARQ